MQPGSNSTVNEPSAKRDVVLPLELALCVAAPDVHRPGRQPAGHAERKRLRPLGVAGLDDDAVVAGGFRAAQADVAAAVFQQPAGAVEVLPARLRELRRCGPSPRAGARLRSGPTRACWPSSARYRPRPGCRNRNRSDSRSWSWSFCRRCSCGCTFSPWRRAHQASNLGATFHCGLSSLAQSGLPHCLAAAVLWDSG